MSLNFNNLNPPSHQTLQMRAPSKFYNANEFLQFDEYKEVDPNTGFEVECEGYSGVEGGNQSRSTNTKSSTLNPNP